MTTTFKPVTESSREQSLDTLRGFAIIGVLFALFLEWDNLGVPPGNEQTNAFKFIDQAANIFLHGKAYNLLAFLFGYGFALQASRAKQKGINLLPFALRRALGLFLLGTLHAVLLRDGDILAPYAICSLFIIALRNSSSRKILVAIGISLLIPYIYYLVLKWTGNQPPPWKEVQVKGTGLFAKNIALLLQHWYPHFIQLQYGALVLFLVGMYASRKQWLEKLQNNLRQLNILFLTGVLLYVSYFFIPWQKIFPYDTDFASPRFYQSLVNAFLKGILKLPFTWAIDLMYIAIILHLLRRTSTKKMLQPLTNIGKMALSNYLLPDMFFIPLYVIFNLWSKVPALQQVMMATACAIFLGVFSTWWLKRYDFGPFEWLLRSFTYWKWQPMKKKEIIQTTGVFG